VRPRVDRGKGGPARVDTACRALFYRRASLLGLRNELIDQGASEPARPFAAYGGTQDLGEETVNLNQVDRRWGKPCARVLQQIQRVGFLPHLAKCPSTSHDISVSFLLKDFLQTFLVYSEVSLDHSKPLVFINLPRASQSVSSFPQSASTQGGISHRSILREDVDMDDVWREEEDTIMQDYVPMAANATSDEATSLLLAPSAQGIIETESTIETEPEIIRQARRSKVSGGQPIRSPHATHGPNDFRPRRTRDQRMRRFIVDRHVRSISPSYPAISSLQDSSPVQEKPNNEPPSRSGEATACQQLGVTDSQIAHRESMGSSIGYARSTIPTPEAVLSGRNSVFQHSGSATPSFGLQEDTEGPSFSVSSSDGYSRSVIPSPPQYISGVTSLSSFSREPNSPGSLNTASPLQQQPGVHGSSITSSHIRPRSTLPTPSAYSLPSTMPPSLSRSVTSLGQNESLLRRESETTLSTFHSPQNAPAVTPSTTNSIVPRSTCPTPPIFDSRWSHTPEERSNNRAHFPRDRYSGWQGFESDSDALESVDLD
jgi:hypothetical protein